ncbi:hypothetical protein AVEN_26589-1, partial [Araneus ventricosus]
YQLVESPRGDRWGQSPSDAVPSPLGKILYSNGGKFCIPIGPLMHIQP